jgi:hypothetical protein
MPLHGSLVEATLELQGGAFLMIGLTNTCESEVSLDTTKNNTG